MSADIGCDFRPAVLSQDERSVQIERTRGQLAGDQGDSVSSAMAKPTLRGPVAQAHATPGRRHLKAAREHTPNTRKGLDELATTGLGPQPSSIRPRVVDELAAPRVLTCTRHPTVAALYAERPASAPGSFNHGSWPWPARPSALRSVIRSRQVVALCGMAA